MAKYHIKYIVLNILDNEMTALRSKAAVAKYCQVHVNSVKEGLVKNFIIREAREGDVVPIFK